ncbi:MAG: hypothetical protein WBF87_07835 [Mesorhizobium sp.]
MSRTINSVLVLAAMAAAPALNMAVAQDCAICAKSVVMNSDLANCFLQKYASIPADAGAAVAVDLSQCNEKTKSIVQALPQPTMAVEPPDTKFMLSRSQAQCLREQLLDGELDLDPSVRIDLGVCQ